MYRLKQLPYKKDYISSDTYIYLSNANYTLGELKGCLEYSPYLEAIMRLLTFYEARNSSVIGRSDITLDQVLLESVISCKKCRKVDEVIHHARAIRILYTDVVRKNKLNIEDIHIVQKLIVPEAVGIRNERGTTIHNKLTGEVYYVPPQGEKTILNYYTNLIEYINNNSSIYDPLIDMAIIHYQFECIHPYRDGNGRVGRILSIMSLILNNRLHYPILNISQYLYETKDEYYTLLKKCHNDITYLSEFVIYMLKGINETGKQAITFIKNITRLIKQFENDLEKTLPKLSSKQLAAHFFRFPYTKNELLRSEVNISRSTATKYLKELEVNGFIRSIKHGKEVIYKNIYLEDIFS